MLLVACVQDDEEVVLYCRGQMNDQGMRNGVECHLAFLGVREGQPLGLPEV